MPVKQCVGFGDNNVSRPMASLPTGLHGQLVSPGIQTRNKYAELQAEYQPQQHEHGKSPQKNRTETVLLSGYISPEHEAMSPLASILLDLNNEQISKSKRKRLRKKMKKLSQEDCGPPPPVSWSSVRSSSSEEYFTCESELATDDQDETLIGFSDTESPPTSPSQQTPTTEPKNLDTREKELNNTNSEKRNCNISASKACGLNLESAPDAYFPNIFAPAPDVHQKVRRELCWGVSSHDADEETDSDEDNPFSWNESQSWNMDISGNRRISCAPPYFSVNAEDEKITKFLNQSNRTSVNNSCKKMNSKGVSKLVASGDKSSCNVSVKEKRSVRDPMEVWRRRCEIYNSDSTQRRGNAKIQLKSNTSTMQCHLLDMSLTDVTKDTVQDGTENVKKILNSSDMSTHGVLDTNNNSTGDTYHDPAIVSVLNILPSSLQVDSRMPDESIFDMNEGENNLIESWSMQSIQWDDPNESEMDFSQLSDTAQAFQTSTMNAVKEISDTLSCDYNKHKQQVPNHLKEKREERGEAKCQNSTDKINKKEKSTDCDSA